MFVVVDDVVVGLEMSASQVFVSKTYLVYSNEDIADGVAACCSAMDCLLLKSCNTRVKDIALVGQERFSQGILFQKTMKRT